MCGIVGMLVPGGIAAWEEQIRGAMDLMARRGPDGEGSWSDGHACAFGFRRLAILDLTPAGHQPMLTADGRYALVLNGEIYNFRELRRELEQHGSRFRSSGDAEVALQALARWGIRALDRFNGMFALGFYDTVERQLLLARDHAGIKPLYYLRAPQGLVFASQYDAILAHPWAGGQTMDPERLSLYLHLGYIPSPFAPLRQSGSLEPGSWMTIAADGKLRQGRYFSFPRQRPPDLRGPEADEAVDAAITAAVKRQLVSDVPLGVFLSGGIDSPLIAAKLRHLAPNTPAFTLGTNGDEFDESPQARAYAAALRLRHEVRQLTPEDAFHMLDDVVAACGEPLDDYSMFPTMAVSRHAREQVKVALSGDGGDDLFWGYPGRMLPPLQRAVQARTPLPASLWRRLRRWSGGPPGPLVASASHAYLASHRFVREDWLHAIFPSLPGWPAGCTLYDFEDGSAEALAQWIRWNEFSGHLSRILLKVDRASMYQGLEVRVPLLDREVVEVAMRVDWRSCLDLEREVGKLPLRHALAREISFQTQPKRGFTVPMSQWLGGVLRPVFEDMVLARSELAGLPFDRAVLREQYQRHLNGAEDQRWGLWRLLSLSLWEARHVRPAVRHG
jgi:asparagine synthase (glutamine-hydrolysing)